MRAEGRQPLVVLAAGNIVEESNDNGRTRVDAQWAGYPLTATDFPDQVIVVGATGATPNDASPAFSYNGALVSIAAPGDRVWTVDGGVPGASSVTPDSGTSLSAPLVAGAAGQLLAFDPRLTTADLKHLLLGGATRGGRRAGDGYPVLNAYESLKMAAERPGAPLCGNRVWAQGGQIWASRGEVASGDSAGSPPAEVLGGFDPAQVPSRPDTVATEFASLAVEHGGRQIGFCANQSGYSSWNVDVSPQTAVKLQCAGVLTYAGGRWGPSAVAQYTTASGAARSAQHLSHEGDSLVVAEWLATGNNYERSSVITVTLSTTGGAHELARFAPQFSGSMVTAALSPAGDTAIVAVAAASPARPINQIYGVPLSGGAPVLLWTLPPSPLVVVEGIGISEDGRVLTMTAWDYDAGQCAYYYWSIPLRRQLGRYLQPDGRTYPGCEDLRAGFSALRASADGGAVVGAPSAAPVGSAPHAASPTWMPRGAFPRRGPVRGRVRDRPVDFTWRASSPGRVSEP